MKKQFLTLLFLFLFSLTCVSVNAAKRMGSGKPVGQQSGNVSQREAAKPAQPGTQPAGSPSAAPSAPSPASAPMASPTRRPWGAMVGGLAAGLGLAWLAHSMGFGAEFGQFLLFGLLAFVLLAVVGYFMRRRGPSPANGESPLAYQAAGQPAFSNSNFNSPNQSKSMVDPNAPAAQSTYNSNPSTPSNPSNWSIPDGFDTHGFL
jgi:predicted lipid-binding transport protein (Tim44 family)